ncbi:uncharacterized protein LOC122327509 isoform X2 [Puntigrus tetrazona]|uniref:uncharacterized protein LOC122327509 isoform X2 n=1 Tax=Puntigrus tetrazona TaxID=1606681 RepID=UPI001C89AC1F|nr:uncharacterized protein LOC122327509 isoform X2 [Puntigrus tetrazona]
MKSLNLLFLLLHGVKAATVNATEGDSVTLHTNLKTNQRDRIRWYFNDTRIAQISGDLSFICTDVQCNEGTERFRDRLELDPQTGSLTITNTRAADSGLYLQEAVIGGKVSEEIFSATITGHPAVKQMMRKMKKEGATDTLDNEVRTSGSDGGDEVGVQSAVKTSALDQNSGNLGVTVGVTLLLFVAVATVAAILCKKHELQRQSGKCTRADAKFSDGLMQDEKNISEEISGQVGKTQFGLQDECSTQTGVTLHDVSVK